MRGLLDKYWNSGVAEGFSKGRSEGLSQGLTQGFSKGTLLGAAQNLVHNVEALMQNLSLSLQDACESIGSSVQEYQKAKSYPMENDFPKQDTPTV